MEDILAKLTNYEIKIRMVVNSQMQGNFHSIFKGSGLEFSDIRPYQYGDDVRAIDWNVTAKGHGTYVKIFKEEKEQNVFFLLDVSGSQEIGIAKKTKINTAKEICGVLAISVIREAGHVGLYCFSDKKELYFKPLGGMKHCYKLILDLFKMKPESPKTDIKAALGFALNFMKRKSIVLLISDFLDNNYEQNLKALARKHDLVVLHIYDQNEITLPSLGIVPILDKETNRTVWINTSSTKFKEEMKNNFEEAQSRLKRLCLQHNANYLAIDSNENYVPKLIQLFRMRN